MLQGAMDWNVLPYGTIFINEATPTLLAEVTEIFDLTDQVAVK